MATRCGTILKSGQVKLQGIYKVQIGPIGSDKLQAPGTKAAAKVPQQVRIAEQHSEYVVIELVCSCGQKSYIQCDYTQPAAGREAAQPEQ